ncbi:Gfo/Idh/MocA family protein [Eoetvoesiella caeni]|uniref:Phthalate 4,5-cis-dihydrodiol dehydrogenase n=1 Tax=Eoetvoesiella caeni TaxID=645616 RepID=A0A366H2I2_9BURK|nr:Gfo/Idh/MocA family oxidoreductase [Eoetvoesiella caeni]MCI2811267.1 Gfo/Idh/MocA family oxidoreductase [Eoetvoesiella caeni]NYT57156.1 Gfo/Idh/MocA family oxidoreductase [Eoetvoesiella caeni]RBP34985.1 phthalate 4,5-cis-dihydrodiol dehydrogenase [Eoetvoesiella caeni]
MQTGDRNDAIGVGVIGLGRAFTLMLPTWVQDERVRLVAAVDPRIQACEQFRNDLGGATYDTVGELCTDPAVEAVYIASPHQFHAKQMEIVAAAGKAILVEKPLAITLEECFRIVQIVDTTQVPVIVGHSHSFDGPVLHAATLLSQGRFGDVRMAHALNYTNFLYRPRRPEELDTAQGGGVVFSQAAHQVDTIRILMGGMVESVRAHTGRWDSSRPTEGAYSALLSFQGGAFASLTYNGYGHYNSNELMGHVDEMGYERQTSAFDYTRGALSMVDETSETRLKQARNFGGDDYRREMPASTPHHQHFGHILVSADKADIKLTTKGLDIYQGGSRSFVATPKSSVPRAEVVDELWAVVREGMEPLHGARWARATMEVCFAILESARTGNDIRLRFQVALSRKLCPRPDKGSHSGTKQKKNPGS